MDNIVTEDADRVAEENRIKEALRQCGYPDWTFNKVQKQMKDKTKKKDKKKDKTNESNGMVVIPYIEGVSERLQRSFKKYNIQTAMKPYNTLKRLLVHPKDKRDVAQTSDCVYKVPCMSCDKAYVGETGRLFGTRLNEHKKDVLKVAGKKFTRANRKESASEVHKSAITDHVAQENHTIDWKNASILDRESNKQKRWIRESIWIRRQGTNIINRDEGIYSLNHVFDPLITPLHPGNEKKISRGKKWIKTNLPRKLTDQVGETV